MHASRLYRKLDRALCNKEWRNYLSEAVVKVGTRVQSDHHLLLISLTSARGKGMARPFRFEAAWLKYISFRNMLKEKWTGEKEVREELRMLEDHLQSWNENVFGHITKKKGELISRLRGIQKKKKIQEGFNPLLEDLETKLNNELNEVLGQEETL